MQDATNASGNKPEAAPPTRTERRARAALDALRTLLRDLYLDRFGAVPPGLDELVLHLRLRAHPGRNWHLDFDPPGPEQILPQFEDAQAALDVFQPGHVYCFRCEDARCPHSRPETPLSVFAGYDAAGRPLWQELAQALITLRDPRVDQLYAERPRALAAVQLGRDLRGEQLPAFGRSSKTYAVLGQAVAGYFPCPSDYPGERIAVTVQLVEARGAGGRTRLHLNPLAQPPAEARLDDWLAEGWQPALDRALAVTRRSVEALDAQVAALRGPGSGDALREALGRVPLLLRRFCESLERGDRQTRRRTRHAEERRSDQRPVHKALDDARSAREDGLYFDERANTFMVCGSRHRVHAFAPDGRHVTSFTLPPQGLAQRTRTRRWRPATPDEFTNFKQAASQVLTPNRDS